MALGYYECIMNISIKSSITWKLAVNAELFTVLCLQETGAWLIQSQRKLNCCIDKPYLERAFGCVKPDHIYPCELLI